MIKVKIAGKINLSLKVLDVKDGFHELDMATSSVSVYDEVAVFPSKTMTCNLTEIVQKEKNTAYIAGKLFAQKFNTPNVDIKITKNIPLMAGMGGSSADGAGVIYAMMKLFDIKDERECIKLAREVGSDVPLMLTGGLLRVQGTGEIITPIKSNLSFNILTICDGKGNSSKNVYGEFDRRKQKSKINPTKIIDALTENNFQKTLSYIENDLQESAIAVNSEIQQNLDFLREVGASKIVLYGSGSACGGFFESYEKAKEIQEKYKDKFKFIQVLQSVKEGIFVE